MPEALLIYQKSADFARENLPSGHPILQNIESVLDSATKDVRKSKVVKKKTKAVFKTTPLMAKRVSPKFSKKGEEDMKGTFDGSPMRNSDTLLSTVEVEGESKPDTPPQYE
jgi:hypothetical protein